MISILIVIILILIIVSIVSIIFQHFRLERQNILHFRQSGQKQMGQVQIIEKEWTYKTKQETAPNSHHNQHKGPKIDDNSKRANHKKEGHYIEVIKAVKNFEVKGFTNFDCPVSMKLQQDVPVWVDIFKDKKYLEKVIDKENVEEIELTETMSVKLYGEDFKITPKNSETQIIFDNKVTRWNWVVKPLRPGTRMLELLIIAKIKISDQIESYDYPKYGRSIFVNVTASKLVFTFFKENWKWLVRTLVGSGIILTVLKIYKIIPV